VEVEKLGNMTSCTHKNLVLMPVSKKRVRCKRCHLTIGSDELGESFCPECFDARGEKLYDFEEVVEAKTGPTRYRCEDCGFIIESD
jgi:protein-arginine kinase activator protein McsA